MDKKEVNKRLHSDGKKINISKAILKNNHIAPKSSTSRKLSYISRAKNVSIPFDKKYNIYATDTKSFLKQTCDKCRIGSNSHMLVISAVKSPQLNKVESGHDLNGNLSFNPHAAFCNFPSDVPNFSLSYQSQQHYELSVQKPTKHKPRAGYHEKRAYNSKINSSKIPFHSNKFFPPPGIGYQNSKSSPASLSNTVPFIKLSTNRMCADASIVADKLNQKCYIKPSELINDQFNTDVKVANFPVFAQSNLPNKTCFTFQVDPESQFRGIKKSDYFIQKWQQISVASLFENPADFKDGDKMLFPALPSNVQTGQIKFNSSFICNMPAELSFDEHSYPESANSISEVITTTESPGTNPASDIPQASYADVIRMSVTCSNSSNCTNVNSDKISESNQNFTDHPESSDDSSHPSGSDWVISRLSQLDHKSQDPKNITHYNTNVQNSVTPHPIVVSLEKPSFYNSTLQNSKSACLSPLLTSDRITKSDDNTNSLYNYEENVDKMSSSSSAYSSCMPSDSVCVTEGQAMCSKTDSLYSSASSVSSSTNAFKSTDKKTVSKKNIFQNKDSPVIIMNNSSSTEDGSEITFGIEYEEMIKLCFEDCDVTNKNIFNVMETLEKCSLLEVNEAENLKTDIQAIEDAKCLSESKLNNEDFIKNKLLFKDKELYWKEMDVTYNQNNHMQLTKYFASLWTECEKDPGSSSNNCDKIQIYQEL